MALTPEVEADILRVYEQTRHSPFKTARQCGVSIGDVFEIVNKNEERLAVASERFGGMGRPELQDFIVGRRKVTTRQWKNDDPMIAQARADYEAGTHEMATGRDGQWLILYSIPRRVKAKGRKDYFLPESA